MSTLDGFAIFFIVRYGFDASQTANAGAPFITSAILFVVIGLFQSAEKISPNVERVLEGIGKD